MRFVKLGVELEIDELFVHKDVVVTPVPITAAADTLSVT